jgi:hypothetical protein
MTWGVVATAGAGIVGGMMSAGAAEDAAAAQAGISREQAAALKEASKWKATGTTNRYGASSQTVDPVTGSMTDATWNMSPEMKAYQDKLMSGSREALPANFDPATATQAQYQLLKNQQAPGVERGYSGLLSNLMGKGTLGLATGGTEGIGGSAAMGQSNPQMEAFMNAVAHQDAANMTGAQTQVRSMMDSDINRANALLMQSNGIEDRGISSLDRTIAWGADQRDAALRGAGASAAQSNLAASQQREADSSSQVGSMLSGLSSNPAFGSVVGGMFSSGASSAPSGVPTYGGGPTRPTGATW